MLIIQQTTMEYCDSDDENSCSDLINDQSVWCYLPDAVLLQIFSYLDHKHLLNAGVVCKNWNNLSYDDLLWRDLFHKDFKTDSSLYTSCKPKTWLSEYKRLCYHIPIAQTETLTEHQHQVLHVSFSHNGKLFATCSKDGYILVWNSKYPVSLKYSRDMKAHSWKYTQYSQFNESDTLLLVSGVHFGTPHSTSGEIAVFSLQDGFELQCRVMNKPYDIFGTWYSDQYLLSGDLHWLAHLVSSSVLWLIKASQEIESEHVPITSQLYRFYNRNASSIRAVMVATCLPDSEITSDMETTTDDSYSSMDCGDPGGTVERGNPVSHRELNAPSSNRNRSVRVDGAQRSQDSLDYACPFGYNCDYVKTETVNRLQSATNSITSDSSRSSGEDEEDFLETDAAEEKYLIFTTSSKTYTPHQIGFKRMRSINFPERLDPGPSLKERVALLKEMQQRPDPDWLNFDSVADKFDKVDHLIDLHGHIIGMALSPDHRYLYVNSRPWPRDYTIANPLDPPPIAQEIDIHVIDLVTLKEVGTMLRAHKAYTPNNECFFIFLDVCKDYVASGAEDKHGYLWDRRYGVCLAKFPHSDVVNSVAFNPRDPEMLVTTSDDYMIKVWRSRAKIRQLEMSRNTFPEAVEVRTLRKS